MIGRRAVLAALLGLPGLVPAALRAGEPVSIDVSRLVEQGWGANARSVADTFRRTLAGLRPVEGRVVVRVLGISMPSFSGSSGSEGRGGGGSVDQVETEVLVLGGRGEIVRRVPVLSSSPSASGGPWYDPASESRRLRHAIEVNAGWIVRSL